MGDFVGSEALERSLGADIVGLAEAGGGGGGLADQGEEYGGLEADFFGCESICEKGDTVTVLTDFSGSSELAFRKGDCRGFPLDFKVELAAGAVAFLLM